MASEQVELGGKVYEIKSQPLRRASKVRKLLSEKVQPLVKLAENAPGIEIRNVEQVGAVLSDLQAIITDSVDIAFDLLCEYDPAIGEDREWLLDNAITEEVIQAVTVMVRQLFPFGDLVQTLSGLVEKATSMNSPSIMEEEATN